MGRHGFEKKRKKKRGFFHTASRIFTVQPRIISSVQSDRLPHLPLLATFNPLPPLTSSATLKQAALTITLTSSRSSNDSTVVLVVSRSG